MKVTKREFLDYYRVQKSGVTNMFDVRMVGELSGLDKKTIMEIITNYSDYADKYL